MSRHDYLPRIEPDTEEAKEDALIQFLTDAALSQWMEGDLKSWAECVQDIHLTTRNGTEVEVYLSDDEVPQWINKWGPTIDQIGEDLYDVIVDLTTNKAKGME
jgi:hypothetical protein